MLFFLNLKIIISILYLKILNTIMIRIDGGRTEIRTQERVAPLPVFKTGAFNHSAILPNQNTPKLPISPKIPN